MARVESIVPFILKWETGTTGATLTNEQLFEKAKQKGYANDPDDLGGPTMCGVTLPAVSMLTVPPLSTKSITVLSSTWAAVAVVSVAVWVAVRLAVSVLLTVCVAVRLSATVFVVSTCTIVLLSSIKAFLALQPANDAISIKTANNLIAFIPPKILCR